MALISLGILKDVFIGQLRRHNWQVIGQRSWFLKQILRNSWAFIHCIEAVEWNFERYEFDSAVTQTRRVKSSRVFFPTSTRQSLSTSSFLTSNKRVRFLWSTCLSFLSYIMIKWQRFGPIWEHYIVFLRCRQLGIESHENITFSSQIKIEKI